MVQIWVDYKQNTFSFLFDQRTKHKIMHLFDNPAQIVKWAIINKFHTKTSLNFPFLIISKLFLYSCPMFTPTLDHLHILVMLVIALFSFRAYNSNTLAI